MSSLLQASSTKNKTPKISKKVEFKMAHRKNNNNVQKIIVQQFANGYLADIQTKSSSTTCREN